MFDSAAQTSNSSVPGTSSGGLHTFGSAPNSREREEAAPASGEEMPQLVDDDHQVEDHEDLEDDADGF